MIIKEINDGFIEPVIEEDAHLYGAQIPFEIIRSDGQWRVFVPKPERQDLRVETDNCTGFNTTNQVEAYMAEKFGGDYNYSERALGIMAGTYPPGNDPQKVYETIRKDGLVDDAMLSFDVDTVEKYYSPNPLPQNILDKARQWLLVYVFMHDWVWANRSEPCPVERMKEALKTSPLAVAVYAWADDNGVYKRVGDDCHWTLITGFDGVNWECADSYEPFFKKLDGNFGFYFVKRIYIRKATPEDKKSTVLGFILDVLYGILNSLKSLAQTLGFK